MKIITKKSKLIEAILPKNKHYQINTRLNKYCVLLDVDDNNQLIYNAITGELVLVNKELNSDDKEYLLNNYFLVSNGFDDKKFVDELRDVLNIVGKTKYKGIKSYTILTTTDCNARCFYCYEKGIEKYRMSDKTASDVAEYIIKHLNSIDDDGVYSSEGMVETMDRNIDGVRLAWFGGEPLYNSRVIDIICNRLKDSGVKYYSSMISNAFLFDDELILKAKNDWKLRNIQITLDGNRDIYNKTKNYIDSNIDPFDKVISNIVNLVNNEIKVVIRLNMTNINYDDLISLVDYLYERIGNSKYFSIYSHLLFQDESKDDSEYLKQLYNKHLKLLGHINNLNLLTSSLPKGVRANSCMADGLSSVVILPDGKLHSCEHINENYTWGSIYTNETKNTIIDSISPLQYWEEKCDELDECRNCAYYPNCIKLKHCPSQNSSCKSYECDEHITKIKWAMLKAYKNYLENINS